MRIEQEKDSLLFFSGRESPGVFKPAALFGFKWRPTGRTLRTVSNELSVSFCCSHTLSLFLETACRSIMNVRKLITRLSSLNSKIIFLAIIFSNS